MHNSKPQQPGTSIPASSLIHYSTRTSQSFSNLFFSSASKSSTKALAGQGPSYLTAWHRCSRAFNFQPWSASQSTQCPVQACLWALQIGIAKTVARKAMHKHAQNWLTLFCSGHTAPNQPRKQKAKIKIKAEYPASIETRLSTSSFSEAS